MISPRTTACGLLGCGLAIALLSVACRERDDLLRAELGRAVVAARPIQGRIVGLQHAPYDPLFRLHPNRETRSTLRSIRQRAEQMPSIESLRNQAIGDLLVGRIERATTELRLAVERSARRAPLLSDLSAAYLELARKKADPFYLLTALETAEEALREDPPLAEALFNRALALESLYLYTEARAAWLAYLKADRDSAWAREAERRRRAITEEPIRREWRHQREVLDTAALQGTRATIRRIVSTFRQPARLYVEEELLGEWAVALSERQSAAASRSLTIARAVAEELAFLTGDCLLRESVAAIDAATTSPGPRRLLSLMRGHREFATALALYNQQDSDDAAQHFQLARQALFEGESPFEKWASFYLGICDYYAFRFTRASMLFHDLQSLSNPQRYPCLLGRLHWMLGLIQVVQADPSPSTQSYQTAINLFKIVGEVENEAATLALLGESFDYLGDPRRAWKHRFEALRRRGRFMSSRRVHSILAEAAEAALRQGMIMVALRFQNEVVSLALDDGSPFTTSHALLRRGITYQRMGELGRALTDLRRARRTANRVNDPNSIKRLIAEIAVVEAEILVATDPRTGLHSLNGAIEAFRGGAYDLFLVPLLLQRSRIYQQLGDVMRAQDDLSAAIAEFERERTRISNHQLRTLFFQRSADLFDEMILLLVKHQSRIRALEYAEGARARTLLDLVLSVRAERKEKERLISELAEPFELKFICSQLPFDTAIVEYSVLADRLLIWIITSDGISFVQSRISAADLGALVTALRSAIATDSDAVEERAASRLFMALLEPALKHLAGRSTLVLVPDKMLHRVPFAVLRSSSTDRLLVQDFFLIYAPSASLHIAARLQDAARGTGRYGSALFVSKPALDLKVFPSLPELNAELDAEISRFFLRVRRLEGREATEGAFLRLAGEYELVQFAGHAFLNPDRPLFSGLALAPTGNSSGHLFARELYGRVFDQTRLVILAACETAAGAETSEGVMTLARPFLAAGVPAVLGSLWRVDDETTEQMLILFHEALAAGENPLAALRGAQLTLASNGSRKIISSDWAAFVLIGGAASLSQREVDKR